MEKGEKLSLWPESPPPGPESDTILQWDASLCSDGGTALGTVEIRQSLRANVPCDLECPRSQGSWKRNTFSPSLQQQRRANGSGLAGSHCSPVGGDKKQQGHQEGATPSGCSPQAYATGCTIETAMGQKQCRNRHIVLAG